MQISSSTAGLYPVLVPSARKPAVESNANNAVLETSTATQQATHQRTTGTELFPAVDAVAARQDTAGLNVGGLTRQFNSIINRESVDNSTDKSAGQRAVAAYADVATQEHRDELVELLGIDVFA